MLFYFTMSSIIFVVDRVCACHSICSWDQFSILFKDKDAIRRVIHSKESQLRRYVVCIVFIRYCFATRHASYISILLHATFVVFCDNIGYFYRITVAETKRTRMSLIYTMLLHNMVRAPVRHQRERAKRTHQEQRSVQWTPSRRIVGQVRGCR